MEKWKQKQKKQEKEVFNLIYGNSLLKTNINMHKYRFIFNTA